MPPEAVAHHRKLATALTPPDAARGRSTLGAQTEKRSSLADGCTRKDSQFADAPRDEKPPSATPAGLPQLRRDPDGRAPTTTLPTNTSLSVANVGNLIEAARRAIEIGLPLNRFVTIDWERAGIFDQVKATGRFLKLARDFLAKNGGRTAHLWVQERGLKIGRHVHILMHVPPHLTRLMSYRQRGWLALCGARFVKGVIRTRPIAGRYGTALATGPLQRLYQRNLDVVLRYVLKDACPKARSLFRIGKPGGFGPVSGKRCGTSQNIGRGARQSMGRD